MPTHTARQDEALQQAFDLFKDPLRRRAIAIGDASIILAAMSELHQLYLDVTGRTTGTPQVGVLATFTLNDAPAKPEALAVAVTIGIDIAMTEGSLTADGESAKVESVQVDLLPSPAPR